jgi:hypothetical protein
VAHDIEGLTDRFVLIDFRMLGTVVAEGKKLTPAETQHLMAMFGTFPPDVESEP